MNIDYDSLFCFVDDFYKGFEPWYKKSLISSGTKKRNRECKMSLSEIITILIAFHQSVKTTQKGGLEDMTLARKLKAENVT